LGLVRMDSKQELGIKTDLPVEVMQESTPITDMAMDFSEEEDFEVKMKKMSRHSPPAWKIVSTQYGVFSPMNQTEKRTSRRRFWYTCNACSARMTENKTGITNHLLKSCLSIDLETKRNILNLLLQNGEDAPYILKMKSNGNDLRVHNAGRSARRGSRQSSAGILRGSQNRASKSPFPEQKQQKVDLNSLIVDRSRRPTSLSAIYEQQTCSFLEEVTESSHFSLDYFPKYQGLPVSISRDSFKDDSSFLALSSFAEVLSSKLSEHKIDSDCLKSDLLERKHIMDSQFHNLEKLSQLSVMLRAVA